MQDVNTKRTGDEPRTLSQNAALHVYCEQVASECLAHGITLKAIVDAVQSHGIYPDAENIKTFFRSLAKSKYGISSTAKLSKNQLQDIYITLRQAILPIGIYTEFPSQEGQSAMEYYEKEINIL